MLINPMFFDNGYKCKKKVMEYLVYQCHLPILGISGEYYYFTDNDVLKRCLKELPISLKISSLWSK